eukprot:g24992.t1
MYSSCHNLEIEIESIFPACAQDTAEQLRVTAMQIRQQDYITYMYTKNKKLEKLGIITTRNQASPGTTVESDKINILGQGLNFCPTTKLDPIGLMADTEEFIRRMRLWEFFHKPQDVSSEPPETTTVLEQSSEKYVVERPKRELNWTPPEGHCPRFDLYTQAIRRHVSDGFISCPHMEVQNISQAQCMAIQALKTNHNIVIKPADKGGAIIKQNRTDYCKE